MLVRAAAAGDHEGVAAVHVRGWQQGYRGLMPDGFLDGLDAGRRRERWRAWLATDPPPGERLLVADDGGRVVGFAWTCPFRPEEGERAPAAVGELGAIYVLADRWGTGVARTLMTAALDGLRADGFASAALWVLEGNGRARRFYDRTGWAPDGTRKMAEFGGMALLEIRYRRSLVDEQPE